MCATLCLTSPLKWLHFLKCSQNELISENYRFHETTVDNVLHYDTLVLISLVVFQSACIQYISFYNSNPK